MTLNTPARVGQPIYLAGLERGDVIKTLDGRPIEAGDREAIRALVAGTGAFKPHEVDVAMELVEIALTQKGQDDYHPFVLVEEDGTVVAWGANNAGQSTFPAEVSNVVAIAAGGLPGVERRLQPGVVHAGDFVARIGGEVVDVDDRGHAGTPPTCRTTESTTTRAVRGMPP